MKGRRGATVCGMLVRRIVLGAAAALVGVVVAVAVPASSATAPYTSAATPEAQSGPSLQTLESRYFEVAPPKVVIAAN